MSTVLVAEIDGRRHRLDDCDWVLWRACGCPQGVAVAAMSHHVIASEDEALREFYGGRRQVQAALGRGERVELVPHDRYAREIAAKLIAHCAHEAA
jgi:hypothetical protein